MAASLEDSVYRALQRAARLRVYRRDELPDRYHLAGPRIPPILAVAEEGWTIARHTPEEPDPEIILGNHGYDDALPSMRGVFVARGPEFRRGIRVPAFRNIHLYPLFAAVLGLDPVATDGSLDSVQALLSRSPAGR